MHKYSWGDAEFGSFIHTFIHSFISCIIVLLTICLCIRCSAVCEDYLPRSICVLCIQRMYTIYACHIYSWGGRGRGGGRGEAPILAPAGIPGI